MKWQILADAYFSSHVQLAETVAPRPLRQTTTFLEVLFQIKMLASDMQALLFARL
jgi:hypothetical protein